MTPYDPAHDRYDEPGERQEVENLLAAWRRATEEGADPEQTCPDCHEPTKDGRRCGECLSAQAEYYYSDEGGSQ